MSSNNAFTVDGEELKVLAELCFDRPFTFVDTYYTAETFDPGATPGVTVTDIDFDISDDGEISRIAVRLDNTSGGFMDVNISFGGNTSNTLSLQPGVFESVFEFSPAVAVSAGDFFTLVTNVVTGNAAQLNYSYGATSTDAFFTASSSEPRITIYNDGVKERMKLAVCSDGTRVVVDAQGNIVPGSLPGDAIPCDQIEDQSHVMVYGTDTAIPAGFKSVLISSISGTTVIDGGFGIGDGFKADNVSFDATQDENARGVLPGFIPAGGSWQWAGILPIAEG